MGVPDRNEPVMMAVACTPREVDFAFAMVAVISDGLALRDWLFLRNDLKKERNLDHLSIIRKSPTEAKREAFHPTLGFRGLASLSQSSVNLGAYNSMGRLRFRTLGKGNGSRCYRKTFCMAPNCMPPGLEHMVYFMLGAENIHPFVRRIQHFRHSYSTNLPVTTAAEKCTSTKTHAIFNDKFARMNEDLVEARVFMCNRTRAMLVDLMAVKT